MSTAVAELDLDSLNPGIRETVRLLRARGFNTIDSGDGVTHECECDLDIPYVHMTVADPRQMVYEANRLYALLKLDIGIDFSYEAETIDEAAYAVRPRIQAAFDPEDQSTLLSLFNVDDALIRAAALGETPS